MERIISESLFLYQDFWNLAMGGRVQQSSCPSHHDHHGGTFSDSHTGDSTDAAMSRWLQSAGLQHLASPTTSHSINPCDLTNLGPQVRFLMIFP